MLEETQQSWSPLRRLVWTRSTFSWTSWQDVPLCSPLSFAALTLLRGVLCCAAMLAYRPLRPPHSVAVPPYCDGALGDGARSAAFRPMRLSAVRPVTPFDSGHASWELMNPSIAPLPVVLGLILYPYVPFIYLLAYKTSYGVRDKPALATYQVVVFHVLLGLALWAYTVALRTPAGSPINPSTAMVDDDNEDYALVQREEARLDEEARAGIGAGASPGPGLMAKASTGGRRFCSKCNVPKPDRCVSRRVIRSDRVHLADLEPDPPV